MYNDKAHVTMEPKTRTLIIPKETKCIGVVGDNKGERVDFDIPRYYDGIDLGTKRLYIVVSNDSGEGDTVIPDVTKDEEQLHISWTVLDKHVAQEGGVTVRIEAKDDDGFCWQSFDGEFEVRGKQDGEQNMPDAQITAVEQTLQEMEAAKNRTLTAAAAALAASAQTAIPIVPEKEGEVITVNDGADRAVRAIKIFGRTTQSGTPTQSAPVPLVTVGADGDVKVSAKSGMSDEGGNEYIKIITQPRDVTATLGTSVVFSVEASGKQLAYQWQYSTPAGGWTNSGQTGSKTNSLTILAESHRDGYKYRCQITDANGRSVTSYEATLTIGNETVYNNPVAVQTATITTASGLPGLPVDSGGNYTDANGQQWIADSVEYDAGEGKGKWIQRVAVKKLTGGASESWGISTSNGNTIFNLGGAGHDSAVRGMCSHYEAAAINSSNKYVGFSTVSSSTNIRFRPSDYAALSLADWKARLADDPITIAYALATPIETELSEEETAQIAALKTYYPETTVYNEDSAHMEVKYVADTKTYIDNLVASAVAVALANK